MADSRANNIDGDNSGNVYDFKGSIGVEAEQCDECGTIMDANDCDCEECVNYPLEHSPKCRCFECFDMKVLISMAKDKRKQQERRDFNESYGIRQHHIGPFEFGYDTEPIQFDDDQIELIDNIVSRMYAKYVDKPKVVESVKPKKYAYAITLTVDPNRPKPFMILDDRIRTLMTAKTYNVKYGYGSIEQCENGQPHAHIYVELTKKVDTANIRKRLQQNDSVDCKPVKDYDAWIAYINKPDTKIPKEILEKHGLKTFFGVKDGVFSYL